MSPELIKLFAQVGVVVDTWNASGYEQVNFLREMDRLERYYKAALNPEEKP